MSNAKEMIMKAKVQGVVQEFMVRTHAEFVYLTENGQEVNLAAKLAEIILSLNGKATTKDVADSVAALKQELLGDLPKEAYDTFTELAAYIEEHEDAATALQEAIGNKADKTTVDAIQQTLAGLGSLATKSAVSESDLDAALTEKLNNADANKHTHANKAELDKIAEGDKEKWDAAEAKAHEHTNKSILDGITAEQVAAWDAAEQNAKNYADEKVAAMPKVFVQATEPADMKDGDIWFQTSAE